MRNASRLLRASTYIAVIAVLLFGQAIMATPAQAATRQELGVNTSATLLRMTDQNLDKRMTDMERLGATWIRVDFNWTAIQPTNATSYNWHMYDRVVRVAKVHNLKVLAVLGYSPRWAQEPRCAKLVITKAAGEKCNPKNTEIFGRFARAAALRYKGSSVRAWEIWNEPNLSSYWKTAQPNSTAVHADPEAYARFANAAAYQLRHHSPGTLVVTGGMAPFFEPKYPKGYRQSDYLKRLLPKLQPALFDAVGIHPYSWPALPSEVATYNAFYTVDKGAAKDNLRSVMNKAGWSHKQIWGTEFGASTSGTRSMSQATKTLRADHVPEELQMRIIKQGVDMWYEKANVGPLFVHSDSDQWLTIRKNEGGFGLRRKDGTKKPAYNALQAEAQRLGN